ncbi:hypothetical protein [uncultured Eubacterium sp.]|uniref:hypothetical protein n=1 Tax=uncultured Eubacterium sp. TaxID=165185 RepID=UPI00261F378D|nr:hypothetical protein [uncultured Eubacterium sp.]
MTFFSQLSGDNKELIKLAVLVLLSSFLSLVVCVLTSVAISEDSKARGIKSRISFAVFGFFFPVPTAIVYLIVRNKAKKIQPKICNCCGISLDNSFAVCPQCGSTQFTDYLIVDNEKHRKVAKSTAISAAVLYILVLIIGLYMQFSGLFYTTSFARDKNNYNYDNGYQYGFNNDDRDDDDDKDDEFDKDDMDEYFNQFGNGQNNSESFDD